MTKRFFALPALTALVLAFAVPMMHAAIATELIISDGTHTAKIGIDSTGALVEDTCVPASACGSDGTPHGTVGTGFAGLTLGNFKLSITAVGGGDSTLPTLMDLVEIDAHNTANAGATLTVSFTDSSYSSMTNPLMIGETYGPDSQIAASSKIVFNVCTNSANSVQACPGGTNISSVTLTAPSTGTNQFNVINPNLTGSLETQTVMTFGGKGDIQSTFTVSNTVPEPASLIFLGTVLAGLSSLIGKKAVKRS